MHEVIGNEKGVQRTLAHLVQIQVVLLLRIGVLRENEDLRQRRADDIVDDTAERPELVDVVQLADAHHVALVLEPPRHPPRLDDKSGCIGGNRLLEADFRAVGEARDHRGVLSPLLGEALLRRGISIRILQSFDVADHTRRQAQALHPSVQIDLHARFVAVAGGKHHVVLLRIDLQDRSDRRVDFGVEQDNVLAVLERLEDELRAKLHRTGRLDQHVDVRRPCQQHDVLGHHWRALAQRVLERVLRVRDNGIERLVRVLKRADGTLDAAVVDCHEAHARYAVDDLIRKAARHEAGPDEAHTNRLAFRLSGLQRVVDNNHESLSNPHPCFQFRFDLGHRPPLQILV